MSTNIIPFPNTRRENRMPIAAPCGQNALGGVVRISRFDAANGRPPSYVENYCYVTPYIFKEAIEKAGTADDREKLRNALSALKTKEHTTGVPIEFDKNGARKEYMYFMEIQSVNGKRTYQSKQRYYIEWDPEVIPVYDLVK